MHKLNITVLNTVMMCKYTMYMRNVFLCNKMLSAD